MGKYRVGNEYQPNTFQVGTPSPLDDRTVVLYKTDLITPSVWDISGETRYTGMVVFVLRDDYTDSKYQGVYNGWPNIPPDPSVIDMLDSGAHLFVLESAIQSEWNNFSAWRQIGGGGSGDDTKNTVGNSEVQWSNELEEQYKKLFLVGVKTKGTTGTSYAVSHVGGEYHGTRYGSYNGDTYINDDGWLHTGGQPVAVKGDLNPILDAIQKWPDVTTQAVVCNPEPIFTVETDDIPDSEYEIWDSGMTTSEDAEDEAAYIVGSKLTIKNHIGIDKDSIFTPNTSSLTYTFKNIISGLTYGYRTTVDGEVTNNNTVETSVDITANVTLSRKDDDSTFAMLFNGDSMFVADEHTQIPAGIPSDQQSWRWIPKFDDYDANTVKCELLEGANVVTLRYTNESKMDVTGGSDTLAGIDTLYHVSNIGRSLNDNDHKSSLPSQQVSISSASNIYATDSVNGVKTKTAITVYGVYPIYSNGSAMTDENHIESRQDFIPNNVCSDADTTNINTNVSAIWNYYTQDEIFVYIKFGCLENEYVGSIFIPVIDGYTLTPVEVAAFYPFGSVYNDLCMTTNERYRETPLIINNKEYKEYMIIPINLLTGMGANGYRIKLRKIPNNQ